MGGNYNKIRKEESSTEPKSSSKRKDWKPRGWGQVGLCGGVWCIESGRGPLCSERNCSIGASPSGG
jgi:hypothetical protein